MKITMIKCDTCGTLHEESKEKAENRKYLVFGTNMHYCNECAKKVSLYDLVHMMTVLREKTND